MLTACSGQTDVSVPHTWTPATPHAATPMDTQLSPSIELADPTSDPPTHIVVLVNLTNSTPGLLTGTAEAVVDAPQGLRVVDSPGCHVALVNNLICRFDGQLEPGDTVTRKITYRADHHSANHDGTIVVRTRNGTASLTLEPDTRT